MSQLSGPQVKMAAKSFRRLMRVAPNRPRHKSSCPRDLMPRYLWFRCCASSSSAASAIGASLSDSLLSRLCANLCGCWWNLFISLSLLLSLCLIFLFSCLLRALCQRRAWRALTEVKSFENLPLMKLKDPLIVAPFCRSTFLNVASLLPLGWNFQRSWNIHLLLIEINLHCVFF